MLSDRLERTLLKLLIFVSSRDIKLNVVNLAGKIWASNHFGCNYKLHGHVAFAFTSLMFDIVYSFIVFYIVHTILYCTVLGLVRGAFKNFVDCHKISTPYFVTF